VAKAKYLIIYEWLSEQIVKKKFIVGDKIPNEKRAGGDVRRPSHDRASGHRQTRR